MPLNKRVLPTPLVARETMGPNEPCWCGSGTKWKRCHKTRGSERTPNFEEVYHRGHKAAVAGYCSHPDAPRDCRRIISAHTVQRNGGLAAIASAGHVLSSMAAYRHLGKNEGRHLPARVGIRDASTFTGYCSFHDNAMFEPIEKGAIRFDEELAFLLSMRAVALERFRKLQGLRIVDEIRHQLDRGEPLQEQQRIQQIFQVQRVFLEAGLSQHDAMMSEYASAFRDPTRASFRYLALRFDSVLPLVTSGAFAPETDMRGSALQDRMQAAPMDNIAFNLTAISGRSVLTLGWTRPSGPAEAFARSIKALPVPTKANAAFVVALRAIENSFISPSWWNNQSTQTQDLLIEEIGNKRNVFDFSAGDGPDALRTPFISANVVDEIGTV